MAIKRPNPLDAVLLAGAQSVGGEKTFTSIPVLPASTPTAANQATRKSYVDGMSGNCVSPGANTLSAAAAAAADGDILRLMAGSYTQSVPIAITGKSLSILGAGSEVSIITCTGCNGIVSTPGSERKVITLKDFTICTTNAGSYTAIQLEGCATTLNSDMQFQIENLNIIPYNGGADYWNKGIRLVEAWSSRIFSCNIRGKNNDTNMSSGIELAGSSVNVQIIAIQALFSNYGINVVGTSEGVSISNSSFVHINRGVCWNTPGSECALTITDSHFNCFDYGIWMKNVCYSKISNNTISKKSSESVTFYGIYCENSQMSSFSGNTISNAQTKTDDTGICLHTLSHRCTIYCNMIRGYGTDIWIKSGNEDCLLLGNVGNGSIYHVYDQGANNACITKLGTNIGIGTGIPGNPLAVNRQANDGTVIAIEQADTVEGTITVSGTTVSYDAFMGSHYTQLKEKQKVPPVGAVMIATGEIVPCEVDNQGPKDKKNVKGIKRKEYFSYVELASMKADKQVYGVYHAKMSDDAKGQSFGKDNKPIYQIAALGLYKIRVTDTNGNIVRGDYIQSSNRPGEGEKQDDNILHNYTVAKAIIDVKWNNVTVDSKLGYKWKLIPATLHCG